MIRFENIPVGFWFTKDTYNDYVKQYEEYQRDDGTWLFSYWLARKLTEEFPPEIDLTRTFPILQARIDDWGEEHNIRFDDGHYWKLLK